MNKLNLVLKKIFLILVSSKLTFILPHKKHTVVLDLNTSYYFINLFNRKKTFFLDTRFYGSDFAGKKEKNFRNEINLFILIYSFFKYILNFKFSLAQYYIINYIKFLDPKNIVTFTDNNIFFLSLKNIFKSKNLIIIQYTWRSNMTFNEMYSTIKKQKFFKKFKVDYTCIWGKNSELFYSQFIETKYLTTGSIKNNLFKSKKNLQTNSIIFISQFRMHLDFNHETLQFKKNKFKDIAIKNILFYCKKNNFKLIVLGCAKKNAEIEKNYFNNLLGKNFIFLKREAGLSSYKNSLKYKYFITFSSSLAYELMSIGKRVALLPFHYKFLKIYKKRQFKESFYSNQKSFSSIWTNSNSKKEISRVLNYIVNSKVKSWKKIQKSMIDPIVIYDKDNKRIKKLFKDLRIN